MSQGEARCSLPLTTALERSDLTEKFLFRGSHTEAETKTTPAPYVCPFEKKNHSVVLNYKKKKYTPVMRWKISWKLFFASLL